MGFGCFFLVVQGLRLRRMRGAEGKLEIKHVSPEKPLLRSGWSFEEQLEKVDSAHLLPKTEITVAEDTRRKLKTENRILRRTNLNFKQPTETKRTEKQKERSRLALREKTLTCTLYF